MKTETQMCKPLFSVHCAVCIFQYAVCSVLCAVRRVHCTVCSVQCAVCSVKYAVCSVQHAVQFSVLQVGAKFMSLAPAALPCNNTVKGISLHSTALQSPAL